MAGVIAIGLVLVGLLVASGLWRAVGWLWRLPRIARAIGKKLGTHASRDGTRLALRGEHDRIPFEISLSPWWITRNDMHCVIWVGDHDSICGPDHERIISVSLYRKKNSTPFAHEHAVAVDAAPDLVCYCSKYDTDAPIAALLGRPEVISAAEALFTSGVKAAEIFGGRVFIGMLDQARDIDPIVNRVHLAIDFWRALSAQPGPYR